MVAAVEKVQGRYPRKIVDVCEWYAVVGDGQVVEEKEERSPCLVLDIWCEDKDSCFFEEESLNKDDETSEVELNDTWVLYCENGIGGGGRGAVAVAVASGVQ